MANAQTLEEIVSTLKFEKNVLMSRSQDACKNQ